jgi:hypothetical protein
MIVALIIACLQMASACSQSPESRSSDQVEPATVTDIDGKDGKRVVLTERAAERLDITTAPVGRTEAGMTVPYASVIYDPNGSAWVYTSPEPRNFVRHSITVDRIDDHLAVLSDGPPVGTKVVAVGAAELYGAELEIGR